MGSQVASQYLRSISAAATQQRFDYFLSHSYLDAQEVVGIKNIIEAQGATVYVDWLFDGYLDRSQVTAETADLLRNRMQSCDNLACAVSSNSPESKWIPWELGYFDGYCPDHVYVLPLVDTGENEFSGQEYLGLYPKIELLGFATGLDLGVLVNNRAMRLTETRSLKIRILTR